MLEVVSALGGRCMIFSHTFDEIKRVLHACERNLDRTRSFGGVIVNLRRLGFTRSDLRLLQERLPRELSSLGVWVRGTPPHLLEFQIDEEALQATIEEDIRYLNPRAILDDIDSIRAVFTLRRGLAPRRLEDAAAVLVTTNEALARAAFRFGKEEESSREISTVITDFSLANVAWLKLPLERPRLPELELMALCQALLEPPSEVWQAFLGEVEKLEKLGSITPEDHELLRVSLTARDELMNLTKGAPEALSKRTIEEILGRVKRDLGKEHVKQLQRQRSHHARTLRSLRLQEADQAALRRRVHRLSTAVGRIVAIGIGLLLVCIVLISASFGLGLFDLPSSAAWPRRILLALAVLGGVLLSTANLLFGVSILRLGARIEQAIARRVFRTLLRALLGNAGEIA